MIKKNIKQILLILLVFIVGIFFIEEYINKGIEEDFFTDLYLYLWNGNLNIVFLIVFLVAFHELCVMDSYKKIFNHFDKYIITRIGYKKFYLNEYRIISLKSIAYYFIVHFFLIFYCLIRFGYKTSNNLELFKYHIFNNNPLVNLIIFIILSSLGLIILNCFIFSIGSFIKNIYLFRFTSLAFFFISLLFSILFSTVIQKIFGSTELIKTIGQSFMVTSLIQPGMAFMMYGYLNFLIAAIIYVTLTIIIISIVIKYRTTYDG